MRDYFKENETIIKEEQEELYEKDLLFWTSWI